jgi:methylmalonyl-CoA mutase C-terminal domain/subunit
MANSSRIKVLVAKPGLDGHDVGAKLVCRALMDAGMEVTYSGLRQSPEQIAAAAEEKGVDVVGLSILSGAHMPLCRKIRDCLEERGLLERVVWIVGGNIPARDVEPLEELGVAGVFGVGSAFEEIAQFVRERVQQ